MNARARASATALSGLALFVAAGCGSAAGTCGVVPCGGDVVGTWQARSACVDTAALGTDFLSGVVGSCPSASLGAVTLTPTGTVNLMADMSFTGVLTVSSTLEVNVPAACTSGASCTELAQVLQTLVGTNGVTSAGCAGSDSCTCTMAQTLHLIDGSGTWKTLGTTLTFAGAASGADGPYCVRGSSLHMLDVDMATMMNVSDIVLDRQ